MRSGVLVLLVWLLPAAARAQTTWYESYGAGLKAVSSSDWAGAEAHLKAAMAMGPAPGRSVRTYGINFIEYTPQYYLGLVYFKQQRHREALVDLEKAKATGAVPKGQQSTLQQMLDASRQETAPRPPPPPVDTEAEEQARSRREAELSKQAEIQKQRADEQARAQEMTRKAEGDRTADEGRQLLSGRRFKDLKALLARARAAGMADARLDELARGAETGERIGEVSRLIARGKWDMARREAAELTIAAPRDAVLADLSARIEKHFADAAPDGPAELERAGLRAFYTGRYEAAAQLLQGLAGGQKPSARVLYYLACTNASLALLQGRDGEALLDKARAQYRQARTLDPRFEGPLISPRVLESVKQR